MKKKKNVSKPKTETKKNKYVTTRNVVIALAVISAVTVGVRKYFFA